MKKYLLAIATVLGLACNASAQGGPGEDNGLGLRLSIGFPGGNSCTYKNDFPGTSFSVDGVAFGLSLDNRWYVYHNDKFGIAVQGRWLDVNYVSGKLGYDTGLFGLEVESEDEATQVTGGVLGVGPVFTWYLNDDMAIDAYYNIMPAVNYTQLKMYDVDGEYAWNDKTQTFEYFETTESEGENNFWGIGVTHHIGAAFRWKVLQAGLEYRFGTIKGMSEFDFDNLEMDGAMNMFKINLGVKF